MSHFSHTSRSLSTSEGHIRLGDKMHRVNREQAILVAFKDYTDHSSDSHLQMVLAETVDGWATFLLNADAAGTHYTRRFESLEAAKASFKERGRQI
jgi:hypothetical protein